MPAAHILNMSGKICSRAESAAKYVCDKIQSEKYIIYSAAFVAFIFAALDSLSAAALSISAIA